MLKSSFGSTLKQYVRIEASDPSATGPARRPTDLCGLEGEFRGALLAGYRLEPMGLADLKEKWSSDGPWHESHRETTGKREQALPELREIVRRFQSADSSAAEFRSAMDSFSKTTKLWGFGGASGQMFLNMLVKATDEGALAHALREGLPAPADEDQCRQRFADFLGFVEEARERARSTGVSPPSLGYAPYFLSFFWEAEDRDAWPIYYPNSRDTLAKHGLFRDTGPLAERYLAYRAQIFRLRDELDTDSWGVEALLWHLKQAEGPQPEPEGDGAGPAPDDLYESFRSQGLIFPDEVVTSLVLSLLTKPFVLLSGISGTGKTQIAIGMAEYLDRRAGGGLVEVAPPESDDSNVYIPLTEARLRRGRTSLTREHQAVFALHGLPDRGEAIDYEVTLPDGSSTKMRLNNIGFSDPSRELYLLFFRSHIKRWLEANAQPGDYLHLSFGEDGWSAAFDVVRPERHEADTPIRRHEVIAVRSDWTDPRGLIGYENPLTGMYLTTDLIRLLLRAQADTEKPYVVILDEMNLARVEYYFSDFLSAIELQAGVIALRESREGADMAEEGDSDVPARLALPSNVLFLGTVNIDETTHAFSPKVLDRANVLVFNEVDVQRFLEGGGEAAASTFRLANGVLEPGDFAERDRANADALARGRDCAPFAEALVEVHELLKSHNLHFGYRILREMTTYVGHALGRVEGDESEVARAALDIQLVQKVLPKLNGGRELEAPLAHLLSFCLDGSTSRSVDVAVVVEEAARRLSDRPGPTLQEGEAATGTDTAREEAEPAVAPAYPRAARELVRMLARLSETGFVSFLE